MASLGHNDPFPFRGVAGAPGRQYGRRLGDVPDWYLELAVTWRVIRELYPEVVAYWYRARAGMVQA